ncbi:MAG: FMN-binding glutamate synthase family protein [Deltaproteobacteria bacterium]|nr:FMN-binding glutamate synthase family protein [Deltaproteobacteria bacterium]
MSPRKIFLLVSAFVFGFTAFLSYLSHFFMLLYFIWVPVFLIGLSDMQQRKKAVLRNFPVIGHFRYILEGIRPELQQYFVETNLNGRPIPREVRSIVYQRAKGALQTLPFGTQRDVYEDGYEWVTHCLHPISVDHNRLRIMVGGPECTKPYLASRFNISAMSYGSLSGNAVMAMNKGAKMGGFSHNTGEGGISPYHEKHGGDLVWQIGTGYFGCRTADGHFSEELFAEKAKKEQVKMIEIKISQGAKPAHGGILPGAKVTPEIAAIRGVEVGKDVLSPPYHSAFDDHQSMLRFIQKLRQLSGGKPVGIKFCVGHKKDVTDLCQTMVDLQTFPDFITVDGSEGGTGAAPLEFSNNVGMPLNVGLSHVHNELVRHGFA